jgi:hypothetical protein
MPRFVEVGEAGIVVGDAMSGVFNSLNVHTFDELQVQL